MPAPECFSFCPHVTTCIEPLTRETQIPAASSLERIKAQTEALMTAAARVAVAACEGPEIEERTVQKNGWLESKKPVVRKVYTCGEDGYAQKAAYYYRKDLMPPQ